MRIPDELRDCVCFVQAHWLDAPPDVGSAFFVAAPLGLAENPLADTIVVYAVTAKHCVVASDGTQPDAVTLFLNKRAGGIGLIETATSDWSLHPTADVAVLQIGPDEKAFNYRAYPTDSLATKDFIEERSIGPGDDVFIAGLLVHHPG